MTMLDNFVINPETGCWEWQGSRDPVGYGLVQWEGKRARVHRLMWVLTNGPIEPGYCVCHHCDNTCCGNPAHLFKGTRQDNNLDKVRKGRAQRLYGTSNGKTKLTDAQVREIKARYTKPSDAPILALEYGVARTTIINIVRGHRRQVLEAA